MEGRQQPRCQCFPLTKSMSDEEGVKEKKYVGVRMSFGLFFLGFFCNFYTHPCVQKLWASGDGKREIDSWALDTSIRKLMWWEQGQCRQACKSNYIMHGANSCFHAMSILIPDSICAALHVYWPGVKRVYPVFLEQKKTHSAYINHFVTIRQRDFWVDEVNKSQKKKVLLSNVLFCKSCKS